MNEIEPGEPGKKKKGLLGLAAELAKSVTKMQGEGSKKATGPSESKSPKDAPATTEAPTPPTTPIGKIEAASSTVAQAEQEALVTEVNQKLDSAATRSHNKLFKDLSTADKLSVLSEVTESGGSEDTKLLKDTLSGIAKDLQQHPDPSPEQWNKIRDMYREIPKQFRSPTVDTEAKVIVERTKTTLFKQVGDNLAEYGLTRNDLNNVARDLEYTAWGGIHIDPAHPMLIDVVGYTYTDANLLQKITQFNLEMDTAITLDDEDQAADLFREFIKDIRTGLNPGRGPGYNNAEANHVIAIARDRIHFINEAKNNDYQMSRLLEGRLANVTTGADFFSIVESEAGGGRVSSHEMDVIEAKYRAIGGAAPNNPEKIMFRNEIAKTVHGMVEGLERNEIEAWRVGGINPVEYQVDQYIRILEKVDHKAGEKLRIEILGRQWMHRFVHELRTSAEPGQELVRESQQLEDVDFYGEILHQPGTSRGLRQIERRAQELIRAETVQGRRDQILAEIAADLDSPANPERQAMRDAGITAESAVRLAERFYFTTGRDGKAYQEFLYKNDLIQYVKDPDGHMVGIIKPDAPIFWNFFRLLYCPEAQMTFFHMGAQTTEKQVKFWKNGEVVTSVGGRGVGALAIAEMMRNHMGLDLTDFFSRRHAGYLVRAWGLKLYDDANNPLGPVLADLGKTTNPGMAADAQEMHRIFYGAASQLPPENLTPGQQQFRELQSKYLTAHVGKNFAEKFGGVGNPDAIDKNQNPIGAVGTVMWEGVSDGEFNKDWVTQVRAAKIAVKEDHALTAAQRTEILTKIDYLNDRYTGHGGLVDQQKAFNTSVKALTSHEVSDYMDLSNANLSEMPFDLLPRLEENIRGNFRDHVSGWAVLNDLRNFATEPSVENAMVFTYKKTTAYTTPENFQTHIMLPVMQALIRVQRGKLPGGFDIFGWKATMSEYGKIRFQKALTDAALHKLMLMKVASGDLDIEQVRALEGKGHFIWNETVRYTDPMLAGSVLVGVIQSELQKLQKEAEKS